MTKENFIKECLVLANDRYARGEIDAETKVTEYLDSLDFVEYIMEVEKQFSITINEFLFQEAPHNTFGEVIEVFSTQMKFGETGHDPEEVKSEILERVNEAPATKEAPFPPPPSKVRKVIYISGKVTGIESEAKILFAKAQKELEAIGYETINPILLPAEHDKKWRSYMRECIAALAYADCMFMLENWQESKGAKIELEMGSHLCLDIIYQENL